MAAATADNSREDSGLRPWRWWEVLLFVAPWPALLYVILTQNALAVVAAVIAAVAISLSVTMRRYLIRKTVPWPAQALGVLLLGLFLAMLFDAPDGMLWALSLGLVGCALLLVRRMVQADWVGPLYFYDLVRLARKARTTMVRVGFIALLAVGLALSYQGQFSPAELFSFESTGPGVSPQQLAEFTTRFVSVCWTLQNLAVLFITPAYVAGAIAEENERKTMPLLFTTHLTNREIVMGKLCARLSHVVAVLLAGMPIMACTQVWGGTSIGIIGMMYLVSFMTLLGVGGMSIFCSVACETVTGAVLAAYALVFATSLGCPCLMMVALGGNMIMGLQDQTEGKAWLMLYVFVQLGIFTGCVSWANLQVRRRALLLFNRVQKRLEHVPYPASRPPKKVAPVKPDPPMTLPVLAATVRRDRRDAQAIPNNPLLWREAFQSEFGGATHATQLSVGIVLGTLGLMLVVGTGIGLFAADKGWMQVCADLNPFFRVVLVLGTTVLCLGMAFRAANCFVRERERQTLTELLLLPLERWEILWAKWLGTLLRWRYLGYCVLAPLVLGLFVGIVHPLGALLMLVSMGTCLALVTTIGVWVSLISRTSLWANFTMALMLMIMFLGAFIALGVAGSTTPATFATGWARWLDLLLDVGLNPWVTWWRSGFGWHDVHKLRTDEISVTIAGQVIWLLLTALIGWAAWRRLEKEGRGPNARRAPMA